MRPPPFESYFSLFDFSLFANILCTTNAGTSAISIMIPIGTITSGATTVNPTKLNRNIIPKIIIGPPINTASKMQRTSNNFFPIFILYLHIIKVFVTLLIWRRENTRKKKKSSFKSCSGLFIIQFLPFLKEFLGMRFQILPLGRRASSSSLV